MKTIDLNIFQLLIILGSAQGLIFAFIIFFKKSLRIKSNVLLGLLVVFIALSNIQHLFIDMDFLAPDNIIRKMYIPIQWLIMPIFYLHVEAIFKKKSNLEHQWYMYIVVITVFLLHIAHFLYNYARMPIAEMIDYYDQGALLNSNFASFIFNGIIAFAAFKMLTHADLANKLSLKKEQERKWYLLMLLIFVGGIIIGTFAIIALIQFQIDHTWLIYTILSLVSFAGYYLGYVGVYRSTIKRTTKEPIATKNGANTYKKIHAHIIEKRLYLNMELGLSDVAASFNITPGYLSQLINTHGEQSFNEYINRLRIEASKKMLVEHQFDNYTIESIGLECGFKSKSNFYAAFKKFTGQTPKAFVKSQKN